MTTYTAPIKDMMFVMNELVDLSELNQLPGIEEVTPDLLESILEAGGRFAGSGRIGTHRRSREDAAGIQGSIPPVP